MTQYTNIVRDSPSNSDFEHCQSYGALHIYQKSSQVSMQYNHLPHCKLQVGKKAIGQAEQDHNLSHSASNVLGRAITIQLTLV